jgi:hypothetical protein
MTIGRIGSTRKQQQEEKKSCWQYSKTKQNLAAVGRTFVFCGSKRHRQLDECRQFDLAGVAIRALPPPPRIIIMSHASSLSTLSSIYTRQRTYRVVRIYNEVAIR